MAHGLYHTGQLVGAYMRMGIHQDVRRSAMLTKDVENLLHVSTLLATGIELSVRVSTRTPLSEAIVALWVHSLFLGDKGKILLPLSHVFSSFQDNGTHP